MQIPFLQSNEKQKAQEQYQKVDQRLVDKLLEEQHSLLYEAQDLESQSIINKERDTTKLLINVDCSIENIGKLIGSHAGRGYLMYDGKMEWFICKYWQIEEKAGQIYDYLGSAASSTAIKRMQSAIINYKDKKWRPFQLKTTALGKYQVGLA